MQQTPVQGGQRGQRGQSDTDHCLKSKCKVALLVKCQIAKALGFWLMQSGSVLTNLLLNYRDCRNKLKISEEVKSFPRISQHKQSIPVLTRPHDDHLRSKTINKCSEQCPHCPEWVDARYPCDNLIMGVPLLIMSWCAETKKGLGSTIRPKEHPHAEKIMVDTHTYIKP